MTLKPGDKVVMNGAYFVSRANEDRIWTVTATPWEDDDGTLVTRLKKKTGLYPVDGLEKVDAKSHNNKKR